MLFWLERSRRKIERSWSFCCRTCLSFCIHLKKGSTCFSCFSVEISSVIIPAVNLKSLCVWKVCVFVWWLGGAVIKMKHFSGKVPTKETKQTESLLSVAWKYINCLYMSLGTIWCQLRLKTPASAHIYRQLGWRQKKMTNHCRLPPCSEAELGDSVTLCTLRCLPVTPGTAGSPIFRVLLAPHSKINRVGGRWMKEQEVQTPWLSSGMPLCWHTINYPWK